MKVKYGILLGFLVGVFNIIPYFGAIFAVILTIIITIFTSGFAKAIAVGIVIVILQQIDANIIKFKPNISYFRSYCWGKLFWSYRNVFRSSSNCIYKASSNEFY